MCFSLFFPFTPTAECHLLPMVPCHVQAEGGTGPAGCSCGVLSRRKGRAPGQSRPGGVCCPSLLGVVCCPSLLGEVFVDSLWGRLCHLLCAWEPAPCSWLHVSQLRPRPHSQVHVSKSHVLFHLCIRPLPGTWSLACGPSPCVQLGAVAVFWAPSGEL